MQLGMIGLGRMGANMARRLMRGGHSCVVYDRSADAVKALAADGATGTDSLAALVAGLARPRAVWVMVPAGGPTESTVMDLANLLEPGDTVIDGGNSFFKDDIRRAKALAAKQLTYVDAGTSGGVFGLERGYCLMVGGDKASASTAEEGYLHCGPTCAGHFVKMVHNGIEYGIMQAIAEGFDIMRGAGNPTVDEAHRLADLPVAEIAEVWRRGSVLSSWLIDLTARALLDDPTLGKFSGHVADSGEGRWTVQAAVEEAVPAEVIAASLFTRFRSRQDASFAEKLLSAMRFQFGGHVERPTGG